jgi:hypothetical protein
MYRPQIYNIYMSENRPIIGLETGEIAENPNCAHSNANQCVVHAGNLQKVMMSAAVQKILSNSNHLAILREGEKCSWIFCPLIFRPFSPNFTAPGSS